MTQNYISEVRWQESVIRESKLKNNRYPWRLDQFSISLPVLSTTPTKAESSDTSNCTLNDSLSLSSIKSSKYPCTRNLTSALDSFITNLTTIEAELKTIKSQAPDSRFQYSIKKSLTNS